MKKLLLLLTVATTALSGFAADLNDFSNYFKVSYKGQEITNGQEVYVTDFEDLSALYGEGCGTFSADLKVENKLNTTSYIYGLLNYGTPTYQEANADPYFWGDAQLCYASAFSDDVEPSGNCLLPNGLNAGVGTLPVPQAGVGSYEWQLHLIGCDGSSKSRYSLTLRAMSSAEADASPLSTDLVCYINYSKEGNAVDEIIFDNDAEGVYYDLQGRRVENPSAGLYIFSQGGKTVKKVIR